MIPKMDSANWSKSGSLARLVDSEEVEPGERSLEFVTNCTPGNKKSVWPDSRSLRSSGCHWKAYP